MRSGDGRHPTALLAVAALVVAATAGCVRYGYQELPDAEVTWPPDLPPTFDGALDGPADASQDRPVDVPQVADKQVTDKQVTDKQVTDKQVTDKQVAPLDQQQPDAGGSFKLAWSRRAGGSGYDYGKGVAVDGAGNVYVTGQMASAVDLGGGMLPHKGGNDVYVASFSNSGAHRWSRSFGSTGTEFVDGLAANKAGPGVYVSGGFSSTMVVGAQTLVSKGQRDVFLAAFNGSNGASSWARAFGGATGFDTGRGVTTDSAGNVYLVGEYQGSIAVGSTTLPGRVT